MRNDQYSEVFIEMLFTGKKNLTKETKKQDHIRREKVYHLSIQTPIL